MVNPGRIEVSDDESQILVEVYANIADGYKLARTYVYLVNIEGLNSFTGSDGCPKYLNFPHKILIEANVHSFSIPLPVPTPINSVSFETQFGSNRWGWFFYYKL